MTQRLLGGIARAVAPLALRDEAWLLDLAVRGSQVHRFLQYGIGGGNITRRSGAQGAISPLQGLCAFVEPLTVRLVGRCGEELQHPEPVVVRVDAEQLHTQAAQESVDARRCPSLVAAAAIHQTLWTRPPATVGANIPALLDPLVGHAGRLSL